MEIVDHKSPISYWKTAQLYFAVSIKMAKNSLWGTTTPDRLLEYIKKEAKQGDVQAVLKAFDRYNIEQEWLMHLGGVKARTFETIFRDTDPKLCLELGTYCGYSALMIGAMLPDDGILYTIEYDPVIMKVAKAIVDYAGLSKKVIVLLGDSGKVIPTLREKLKVKTFDFIFIDHHKPLYCRDLKIIEKNKLLRKGTVVAADDLGWPGAPDYDRYVQESPKYRSTFYCTMSNKLQIRDVMGKSVYVGE